MGLRSVDLTKGKLSEDEMLVAAAAMETMIATEGWKLVEQLVANNRYVLAQMIHDPAITKDYLSGLMKAVDTIPENVAYIITTGQEIRKRHAEERAIAADAPRGSSRVSPFVKPGGSSPAS